MNPKNNLIRILYMYTKKVLKHFLHPKFFGKIQNPDGVGRVGNPTCGDIMELSLKIDPKTQKIKDVKFHTTGCAAAIASSDMVAEAVKGKTIEQALNVNFKDIIRGLGELPPVKIHCSVLATGALKLAIEDYFKKGQKS